VKKSVVDSTDFHLF